MAKAFDVAKFRKGITKSVKGLSVGFRDPKTWISTGNYTLNRLISGDFNKGVPLGKVTMFAGESGSGKSFICSGNLVKHAQDMGIFVVLIDSENALDEKWLHALDVDTSEDKLLKLNMAMIDDVAKVIADFVSEYRAGYGDVDIDERPEVLFVVDSLGMLMSPTDLAQFEKGEMKGDMGRKPRQLKALVTNCVNMFGDLNIGLVATNHTYQSQDMFDPDDKISGGQGFIYASSIVVALQKLKLKEGKKSVLSGVPSSLPALVKATRIQEKVKGIGFEWKNSEDVWSKVKEELEEFEFEVTQNSTAQEEEFGDLIFSLVNYARFKNISPESALSKTNLKFITRFQLMEKMILENGQSIAEMNLEAMDEFWEKAKDVLKNR